MTRSRIALVRIGNARVLTQAQPEGPFAEVGIFRSKTPV